MSAAPPLVPAAQVVAKPVTPEVSASPAPNPPPSSLPRDPNKVKTTLNLNNILKEKPVAKPAEKVDAVRAEPMVNKDLDLEQVKKVWKEFAEQRKNQIAHYSMLSRDFELRGNQIFMQLSNPVEEPLLQSIKSDLLAFLRDNLNHSLLQLDYTIAQYEAKRMAYTNKEKFDALAEKNPVLKKMQEKFGLDPDF